MMQMKDHHEADGTFLLILGFASLACVNGVGWRCRRDGPSPCDGGTARLSSSITPVFDFMVASFSSVFSAKTMVQINGAKQKAEIPQKLDPLVVLSPPTPNWTWPDHQNNER